MSRSLACLLMTVALSGLVQAKPIDAFPPDPAGAVIEDRLFEELEVADKALNLYAVMYHAGSGPSKVDIYSGTSVSEGMEWKKLHTWNVPKGPDKVQLLEASAGEGVIQFSTSSWFKYVEARAVPVLTYDPKTGTFTETLED